ncbi:MAG: 1-acyl-sn-glycerol-3-phosphate acyltransferase [Pedobacter sp.]|nr:MAG: 1-acyl-sn-glycerol-3-phosphate acyltransferase [Pedobacter sp.]
MTKVLSGLYLLYCATIFILLMIIVLPLTLIASALLKKTPAKRTILFLLRCWAWSFSILSGFWFKTCNKNKINLKKQHIYVGNHGSYLDAIAVCIAIPQHFSPLGKIEMTKIPIFGSIYKRIVIMIDRNNKESREFSVNQLKQEIADGQSILIFPEGTMNKTNAELTEFYDGAFRIAIETQIDIIPFVMINNRKLLPRINPFEAKPGFVKTIFINSVSVKNLSLTDVPALKKEVFELMKNTILAN